MMPSQSESVGENQAADWQDGRMTDSRTTENNPIRVNWIDDPALHGAERTAGRLGMTFLPGKKADGISGRHDRILALDAQALRDAWNVALLVVLVEDHELARFHVADLERVMNGVGIDVVRFPIPDGAAPSDTDGTRTLVLTIQARLDAGDNVAIACRGGLGRTGTIAACTLIGAGLPAREAIQAVRVARHGTIETSEQENFVASFTP